MINGINKNIKTQVYHIISWITLFFIKMRRKRSASNILKDTIPSTSISSTPNQPSTEDIKITTRKPRTKVQCFCSKCSRPTYKNRTWTKRTTDFFRSITIRSINTFTCYFAKWNSNDASVSQPIWFDNGNWGIFGTNNNRYQYVRRTTFHLSSA